MGKLKNGIDEKSAKRKIEFKVMMGVTYMTYKTKTPLTHIIPKLFVVSFTLWLFTSLPHKRKLYAFMSQFKASH